MKKSLFSFAGLLTVLLVFTSCNNNTPRAVATRWLNEFYHMDYEKAKKESTDDTKELISTFEMLSQKEPDSTKEELKKEKIEIKEVKEDGDKATVTYVNSDVPNLQTLHLVKVKGKWLVQWSKQDQMNDAGDSGQPDSADTPAAPPATPDTSKAK